LLAKRLIETTASIETLIERQTQFHALHDRGSVCNRVFDMNLDSAGANYQPDMERVLGETTFMHDALQYQTARHCKTDWRPSISRTSSFTIDQLSISTSQLSGGTAYRYSSVSISSDHGLIGFLHTRSYFWQNPLAYQLLSSTTLDGIKLCLSVSSITAFNYTGVYMRLKFLDHFLKG
jgi:hypothetical protein